MQKMQWQQCLKDDLTLNLSCFWFPNKRYLDISMYVIHSLVMREEEAQEVEADRKKGVLSEERKVW